MKLSYKLTIILLSISIFPLICFGVFINYILQNDNHHNSLTTLSTIASQQKQKINIILERNRENLENIANNNELRLLVNDYQKYPTPDSQTKLITILTNSTITDKNIFLLDKNGIVIASNNPKNINVPYYDKTLGEKSLQDNFTDIVKDREGNIILVYSTIVTLNSEISGSIIMETDTDEINTIVKNYSNLGKTGETTLAMYNSEGKIIFIVPLRFDVNAAFTRMVDSNSKIAMVQAMKRVEKNYIDTVDYRGNPVYSSTRYIDITNWGLVVKKDTSEIFAPIINLQRLFLIFGIILIVFITLLALYISNIIVNPIKQLIQLSEKISTGDFTKTKEISSNDEIGQLGKTFNLMSDKLNSYYKTLEGEVQKRTQELEQAKISLEIEVSKRTEQLQQAKSDLEIEVAKRTSDLHIKIDELETMNKTMINRELKMVELKEQIQKLEEQLKNKG